MKKIIKTSIPLFLYLSLCCFAQAQYVTLQGKQFKDAGGNNFYPMVVNYGVNIAYNNSGTNYSDYEIAPGAGYGTSANYEHTPFNGGHDQILTDLLKIKSMGFNTVRVVDIAPSKNVGSGFSLVLGKYPYCSVPANHLTLNINPDYSTDANTQNILFPKIREFLDIAGEADIKVILLCGGGPTANNAIHSDDYADFLGALASYISDHPALLAYDMYNEPHWATDKMLFSRNKSEICSYVDSWYQAIKAHDQNHLITMGACGPMDVMDVDPALVKVDFLSEHFYPGSVQYELYDKQKPIERIKGMFYWFNNNLPMPWIVGETGFSASEVDVAPGYNHELYIWGNYADQTYYAQQSQQLVLNYGGSGYSWWDFQNKHWYNAVFDPDFYHENFFGLLNYGDYPYQNTYDKPMVADAFTNNIPSAPNGSPVQPTDYYNPMYHPTNNNPGCHVSGTVTDQNGQHIKDAVVIAWTDLGPVDPINDPSGLLDHNFDNFYTYTDANGEYSVNAYDYWPPANDPGIIANIQISALGAERLNWGWSGGTLNSVINPTLHKIDLVNNLEVIGQNISGTQNYQAWNTITVSNTNIQSGGSSNIKARYSVDVQPEFHAWAGSEVHLYCETVYADCNEFSGFQMQRNAASTTTDNNEQSNSIEIQFKKNSTNSYLSISPNPSNGLFQVLLVDKDENTNIKTISIHDLTGRKIKTVEANSNSYQLDLSILPKGIYFLQANDLNNQYNKKIIIN